MIGLPRDFGDFEVQLFTWPSEQVRLEQDELSLSIDPPTKRNREVSDVNRVKQQELPAESYHRSVLMSQGRSNTAQGLGRPNWPFAKSYIPHLMSRSGAACLAVPSLLALSGCTPLKVKLGVKVYLDKTPIASIRASLPRGPGIAPGEKSPLVVTITGPDGKVLVTEGQGRGKVMWKDLVVTASVVTANQKGIVSLPRDPRVSEGKVAHVTITVPSHPDLRAEIDIPVRYNYSFNSNFPGSSGSSGMGAPSGRNGSDGSSGRNAWDGSPGRGGGITETYDPQAKPFLTAFHLSNQGGPPPVFKEEPVAPLW